MGDELRERLAAEIQCVDWSPLGPHAERGGLILVDAALQLAEVGAAIAQDERQAVQSWMEQGQLRHATDAERERWGDETEARFQVLIVQPYVLAQRVSG